MTARTLAVARGDSGMFMYDTTIAGTHVRVVTAPLRNDAALQLVRPLDEVDAILGRLRWILSAVMVTGVAVAAALGAAVSRTALGPVRRLTETAESVSTTLDLSERIEETGQDEIGRLGASFNRMLQALEGSVSAQRQLVADASHELRTPLTSLRVNVETLLRNGTMPPHERERLGEDIVEQLGEMTILIDEVVEVARGDTQPLRLESVELDEVVSEVVQRRRRDSPATEIVATIAPVVVEGDRARIERAVANLVDNACKWSPQGGTVEVQLDADGRLFVRDEGPGFDEVDLPHVFDRFYRSADARSLPGSGLGLAIVQQVAETHHGQVTAANRPRGGAVRLPRAALRNFLAASQPTFSRRCFDLHMTPTNSMFRLPLAIAAAVIAALALVAAGCGGSGSSSDASGTGTTSTTATPSSTGSNSAFAECLKENGIEGFDPGSSPQGGPPQNVDPAAMQKAMQACGSLRPQGQGFGGPGQNGPSSAQRAELQSCLKEHGIEGFSPGSAQSDADRQKLQEAMQACGGPGAGGAPPGAGNGGTGGSGSFAAFSRCMRNRGIVLPGAGSGSPTDTTSAKYKLAQKACRPLLNGNDQ